MMKTHRFFVAIILVTLSFGLSGKASRAVATAAGIETPQKIAAGNDVWRTYTNANYINALAVEGQVLWAATGGGLARWDLATGSYEKILQSVNGLAKTTVTAVVVDGLGNKWIGTTSGLHRYDGANWTRYTTSNGLASNYIQDLALDGSGNLWVATGNGVSVFNGVSWTKYNTSNSGLINNNVNTLAISGNVKWFGSSSNGLSKFDGTTWITYTLGTGEFYENFINDIAIAPGGVTWIATGNSMGGSGGGGGALVRFDGANWTSYTPENSGLANPYVFSVAVEPGGAVWAGTESGASRFDGVSWTSYTPADGLAHYWVSALLLDGSSVWFGTNGGGISKLSSGAWKSYRTEDQLPHNIILGIGAVGSDVWLSGGDYYIINERSGLMKFDGYNWKFYDFQTTMMETYNILPGPNNQVWFSGWEIMSFDGVNWVTYTDPYASGKVSAMAIDGNDKWFYSYQPFDPQQRKWVSKFDGTNWTAYTTSNSGLIATPVNAIAIDIDHAKWFGTSSGVSKFDGSAWTSYTTTEGLVNNKVNAIVVDAAGNKWFGTGGGVSKFNGTTWTSYTTGNSGLASNTVNSIAIDAYGVLWFGTNGGVSRFDGTTWITYTTSNSGLADNTVYKVVITSVGHKWFSTAGGVSEFYTVPTLSINFTIGAPGSFFNLSGAGFPALQTATISVNGHVVGSVQVDADGAFTFTLTTPLAGEGIYWVTASVNPSANTRFVLDSAAETRPKEGDLTPLEVPAGIAFSSELFLPSVRR